MASDSDNSGSSSSGSGKSDDGLGSTSTYNPSPLTSELFYMTIRDDKSKDERL